jgi:hypothetical protein
MSTSCFQGSETSCVPDDVARAGCGILLPTGYFKTLCLIITSRNFPFVAQKTSHFLAIEESDFIDRRKNRSLNESIGMPVLSADSWNRKVCQNFHDPARNSANFTQVRGFVVLCGLRH